jgi:hypothetical protein
VGVVVVVGMVVVVVVAQEVFYLSLDLRMSELRKSGSVCMWFPSLQRNIAPVSMRVNQSKRNDIISVCSKSRSNHVHPVG